MSTRFTKSKTDDQSISMGYEGDNVPDNFSLPECTIEDVDRALFDLFNEEIPFLYNREDESRRVPVIFATGERFAILRRKRPLRDKAGVLILPLVSMVRSSIDQDVSRGIGPGQTAPLVIKKRLDKNDPKYQALINKTNLINQDNVTSPTHFSDVRKRQAKSGKLASKRPSTTPSLEVRQGQILVNELGFKNIYEIITIPPVKFFTATYEITFWTQYTQHMNNMLSVMMSSYIDKHRRTMRIETKKGYWFVAYVNSEMNSNSNFDDFTDNERIVRYTFNIEVPAYIINAAAPGMPNALRSFTSTTDVSFEFLQVSNPLVTTPLGGPISGDPDDFTLQDLSTTDSSLPGTKILGAGAIAGSDTRDIKDGAAAYDGKTVNIGGGMAGPMLVQAPALSIDPFTGKKYITPIFSRVMTAKGETTFKDLTTGEVNPDFNTLTQTDI